MLFFHDDADLFAEARIDLGKSKIDKEVVKKVKIPISDM